MDHATGLKVWVLAARPKTLAAAVAPVVMGCAIALRADAFHFWAALAALLELGKKGFLDPIRGGWPPLPLPVEGFVEAKSFPMRGLPTIRLGRGSPSLRRPLAS